MTSKDNFRLPLPKHKTISDTLSEGIKEHSLWKGLEMAFPGKCNETCDIHLGRHQRSSGGFCYRKPSLVILPPPCCSVSHLSYPIHIAVCPVHIIQTMLWAASKISITYKSIYLKQLLGLFPPQPQQPACPQKQPLHNLHRQLLNVGSDVHCEEQRSA